MQTTRIRGLTVVGYSVLAYAAFLAASAWSVTFLADLQLPRGIDHGAHLPAALAVVVDSALLLAFALQHSVMARRGFKRRVARWIPAHAERSTYVLATSLVLLLLFWQWQPMSALIWSWPRLSPVDQRKPRFRSSLRRAEPVGERDPSHSRARYSDWRLRRSR